MFLKRSIAIYGLLRFILLASIKVRQKVNDIVDWTKLFSKKAGIKPARSK